MQLSMLKGKIHRATVTAADRDYVGSITIDAAIMTAAGIMEYEHVVVADVDNGARLETYVMAGEVGSGIVCMNGAAAALVNVGDKVIIMAFATMTPEEARTNRPRVVVVDDQNVIARIECFERPMQFFDHV